MACAVVFDARRLDVVLDGSEEVIILQALSGG